MNVRITADGLHWIVTLKMVDDRYVVMVDGNEVASYPYIYGSCAAISEDGKHWAVFADTELGEYCLVIDGIIYGPYFASPPGTGYNAKPLVFDEKNVLWCPVKINEKEWVITCDGETASESRQLWRDIEFASGYMSCRSVKNDEWYVHFNDQEWGPFKHAHDPDISSNHIHFGDWVSEGFEHCVALAISENEQHIAFVAARENASFVGNQHQLWGPFDVLHMNPLVLNDGRIAWMNQYDDYIALCVDGIEITQIDAIYGGLREIKNSIGFIATKGND
jgi:hypothetical protein